LTLSLRVPAVQPRYKSLTLFEVAAATSKSKAEYGFDGFYRLNGLFLCESLALLNEPIVLRHFTHRELQNKELCRAR
jgi:hypothetical protein